MAGELVISEANWLEVRNSADAVPMPFRHEIFLDDMEVAGTMHVADIAAKCRAVNAGDELVLLREPKNEHDTRAIRVETKSGVKLGYVPRRRNAVFSRLMDAGKFLVAKLQKKELVDDYYMSLTFGIYLKDI